MKTKNLFRLGALCLALALISTALLSGTFAKYATAVAGKDTALVQNGISEVKMETVLQLPKSSMFSSIYTIMV